MIKRLLRYGLLCLSLSISYAQVSPDCSTAIPICRNVPITGAVDGLGVDDFNGKLTLGDDCLQADFGSTTIESNSSWYRFKTGESGELGFNIKFENGDDWDFALFKAEDCSNLGDPVRCNFYDNREENGYTGVGENPLTNTQTVQYDTWLQVEPGEVYYLLINNFSNRNLGFSIQFSGQIFQDFPDTALDCSIFDNLLGPPRLACEGDTVELYAAIPNATEYTWYEKVGNNFVEISGEKGETLNVTTPGIYKVLVRLTGADAVESEVQVTFSQVPVAEPLLDMDLCDDDTNDGIVTIDLTTKNAEVLGTQSDTDFRVTYHSYMNDANLGINALSDIHENSTSPYSQELFVRLTSIFNPDCYDVSQSFMLNVYPSPEVQIDESAFICIGLSSFVTIGDMSSIINPGYSYNWSTGDTTPTINVTTEGIYSVTITDTNSLYNCSVTKDIEVVSSETPAITDIITNDFLDNNTIEVIVSGNGDYEYKLGDSSFQDNFLFTNVPPGAYELVVRDKNGCGEAYDNVLVIGFLRFFTPNGDGANDTWEITGLTTLTEVKACIYDRYGKPIKQITKTDRSWDGTYKGIPMPATDYWIRIEYVRLKEGTDISGIVTKHFTLKR